MKLILALILGFVFVTSPVMAEDGKKPAKEEKAKKKKKEKKEKLPPELVEKRKEIMAKVKAGDMTKKEGKAAIKQLMQEHKESQTEKEEEKEDGDK